MGLDPKNAIRMEKWIYIFNCIGCSKEIKSKKYYLNKHSGKCKSCSMKKKPFEHVYNRFKNTAKSEGHKNELTYEDFLRFTKINECYYCQDNIPWNAYVYSNNKYTKGGYFLDRKDNNKGYILNNAVVCCTRCNIAKKNMTKDEYLDMCYKVVSHRHRLDVEEFIFNATKRMMET